MLGERSQEELAGGFLRCRVGASTIDMPTLKMRDEREWKSLLASKLAEVADMDVGEANFSDFGDPQTWRAAAKMIHVPGEVALDLVVAYDKTERLGGREWLEQNADSEQIWTILKRAALVVFPFVASIDGLMAELRKMQTMSGSASPGHSPTNGASLTGISLPSK